jgi:hypothetical protein
MDGGDHKGSLACPSGDRRPGLGARLPMLSGRRPGGSGTFGHVGGRPADRFWAQEVSAMSVEPVDLRPLLDPTVWVELGTLAIAWVCAAGACAGASLLVAARRGWLRP